MTEASPFGLQFKEQVEFFRAKRSLVTYHWLEIAPEDQDGVFTIPGIMDIELLNQLRSFIDAAIADGDTLREFVRNVEQLAASRRWDLEKQWGEEPRDVMGVLYELNLRQSHNAGRWGQLQKLKPSMPFWQYRGEDCRESPPHQRWNGLVLLADDPWWHTHYPANSWGCKCAVRALSRRDLDRLGRPGPDKAPPLRWRKRKFGQFTVRMPAGIEPPFDYAPGRRYWSDPVRASN